ncbi:MAG TPA: hypothetical protein VGH74_05865, partial [Planctomycetaceae bacterium]
MILTDAMLWRMIWKEYRVQRGLWLVIAGFAVVLMLLFLSLLHVNDPERIAAPWVIAVALPAVYALACAAVMFATESEDGTTEMLRIMAARTSRVFLGKVGFCLVSTASMWGVLLAAALLLTWGHDVRQADRNFFDHAVWAIAIMTVQFLAWGFLFSSLCKKALTAVCLTAVTPFVVAGCAMVTGLFEHRPEHHVWYVGLVLVVPLVGLAYFVTQRALTGRTYRSYATFKSYRAAVATGTTRVPGWLLAHFTSPARAAVNPLDRLAAVKETSPLWRRTIRRLAWLEFRNAFSIGHALWIAAVYVLVFVPSRDRLGQMILGMVGIGIVPLFMGVWTFQAEGGRRIRFLADHGLSPQVVWLTKQLVWGLLTAALTIPFLVAVAVGNSVMAGTPQYTGTSVFHEDVPGASATLFAAILAGLGYGAGQFASMLIARGVTAGFIGGVLSYLLALGAWFIIELRVPVAISVAPLFVILMATTLCWSRHWLLEQATARAWLKLAAWLATSLAVVYAGIGAFRVYDVPRPDFVEKLGPLREAHGIAPSAAEIETASLYRQAVSQLKTRDKEPGERPAAGVQTAINGWEHATDRERSLLAENQEALRQGMAATERPTCSFFDPTRPISEMQRDSGMPLLVDRWAGTLATLILLSAREKEAQGQLGESLDRYVAVLRMVRHLANRGTTGVWHEGVLLEAKVSSWIGVWAAHPDQTAEGLETAAVRIGQEAALYPSLYDAVLTEQFMLRRVVRDDWSELLPRGQNPGDDARSRTFVKVLNRCCPWECVRVLRVLDLLGASELHCLDVLANGLTTPGLDMQHLARLADAVPETEDPTYLWINQQYQPFPGNRLGPGD